MSKKKKIKKASKAKVSEKKSTTVSKKFNFWPWVYGAITLVGILYVLNVASQYVDFGLDRDESSYANFGEVLRTGGDMYDDAYSFKPPAIFYSYAMINTIFGYTGSGLRWSLVIANALGALMLFLFVYRWKGAFMASITALAFSFFSFNPQVFGFAALAEQYQNIIAIAAAIVIQHGMIKKKWIYFLLGGAIFTYAVLFKQNLIFAFVALSGALIWYYLLESKSRQWKAVLYYIGGCALATILIYLPVIIQGNLSNSIYWNFTYSSLYTSSIPWEKGQEFLVNFFKRVSSFNFWMWVIGAIGVLVGIIKTKPFAIKLALLGLFLATVAAIFPGLRFYPHYWTYFNPILAVGCGLALYYSSQLVKTYYEANWTDALLFAAFIVGLFYVRQSNDLFFDEPKELHINRLMYGDNPFTENRYLGEHLKKVMKRDDELLIFGSEPEMYSYIGKPSPTPYIFFAHLTRTHERQKEMVKDLQNWANTNKPKYVYFSNHPFSWVMTQGADQSCYSWASSYVARNHKVIGVADILPGQSPKIILGPDAANYQVQSQKWVKIYERVGQ